MTTHLARPKFRRISVEDLEQRLGGPDAPRLIDVREAYEWEQARIEGAELKPLSEIHSWWQQLEPEEPLVIYCHHGVRSDAVCRALAAEGFADLSSLDGGVDAWADRVDPAVPRY